ncbi:MAG TPA: MerR family transcriptional regulator [Caulobacterales bacterium]|jgi:hypothetical protein|nr:MerR family transcriptional regulator [Caulobacterales bacterium]
MTKQDKQIRGRRLSLAHISKETGVPLTTLRLWKNQLAMFAGAARGELGPEDIAAARALKRFLELDGATLDDARALMDAAGPAALVAALGRAPDRANTESPARRLQSSIQQAAAAGLFGAVVAEVSQDGAASSASIASLDHARVKRLLAANDAETRKRG